MPLKLTTTVSKIATAPNPTKAAIINEFYQYMKANGASEHHQNNNLKVVIAFAKFLGPDISFYDIKRKEQIIRFLDTKAKTTEQDPDKKWITTWNNYLHRIKLFIRWLYNGYNKQLHESDTSLEFIDWETPTSAKIKAKKTKRISPYLESEIWEQDELLTIIKYEPYKRNKAALTLFWDLKIYSCRFEKMVHGARSEERVREILCGKVFPQKQLYDDNTKSFPNNRHIKIP